MMLEGSGTTGDETDPSLRALLEDVASLSRESTPPERLAGRYVVGKVLGTGGMGTVYSAVDERLGRVVALKWMRFREGERVREATYARFLREARAAARVRHPNVVQVLDVSPDPGTPFITMELLDGETLERRIARGAMSWREAQPLIEGVLHGLDALHAAGVVHRDIKPSNVFLTRTSGEQVHVKVLDLGVAHMADAGDASTLTRTGAAIGTPAYMPLEQLRGEAATPAVDVYAVGVMMYETLTGSRPFTARTAADLAVQIATQRAPDISRSHDISPRQNAVLQRALSRNAHDRFASAKDFGSALSEARDGESRGYGARIGVGALFVAAALWITFLARNGADLPTPPVSIASDAAIHPELRRLPPPPEVSSRRPASDALGSPAANAGADAPDAAPLAPDPSPSRTVLSSEARTRTTRVDTNPHRGADHAVAWTPGSPARGHSDREHVDT